MNFGRLQTLKNQLLHLVVQVRSPNSQVLEMKKTTIIYIESEQAVCIRCGNLSALIQAKCDICNKVICNNCADAPDCPHCNLFICHENLPSCHGCKKLICRRFAEKKILPKYPSTPNAKIVVASS